MLADPPARDGRPPRRPGRRHRLQPGRAGAAVPRQPADGHARHRGRPRHAERRDHRARRHGVLVPEVHAGAVPRGEPVGRLPGGDQRAVRPGQEGPPRPRPGQRDAVRPALRLPHPDQPLRARRQVPPRRVARDPGADQEVRRGRRARATTRSRCGAPAGPAASTSTSTTPPRPSPSPPSADVEPGAIPQPVNLGTDHEVTIRETVETIARLVGFAGELRWDPTKPDGQPRRRVDAAPGRARPRLAGPDAVRGRPAGAPSTGTSPTAPRPSAAPT